MNLVWTIIIDVITLAVGAVAGYYFHRYQTDKAMRDQQDKTASILKGANEQARLIEAQARENAVKVIQTAEQDVKERRAENSREAERLDKRRTELESRADKMEQR